MKFNTYRTAWDIHSRMRASFPKWQLFYDYAIEAYPRSGLNEIGSYRLLCEKIWLAANKPYYKLWPAYAAMLLKTKLDLPSSVLRFPHPVFSIIFPDVPEIFEIGGSGTPLVMKALLVFSLEYSSDKTRPFGISIDFGGTEHAHSVLKLEPDDTIQSALDKSNKEGVGDNLMTLAMRSLKLAVGVSLLAVSAHRCVEHDVIAALRERYDAATTDEQREYLADKSKRRGVYGWNIGRGRDLALTTPVGGSESCPSGRSLTYQHVRGGHFHTVRHGPGHQLTKVMFFEPTIVRPDLPVPEVV